MSNNTKISQKFTVGDVVRSNTAIRAGITEQQTPGADVLKAAAYIGHMVLDKIPGPFVINSWYRCPRLNKLVKGSSTSDHMQGCAVDIDTANDARNGEIFHYIRKHLSYDQLIWEFGDDVNPSWVHVSCKPNGNRNQVLVAYKDSTGKTKYKGYNPPLGK